jgi:ribosome-binding protein aMBF1 (putative translation factor)
VQYRRGVRFSRRASGDAEPGLIPVTPTEARQLGAAIARERDKLGVSREQVAATMGVDVTDVAALEQGSGPDTRGAVEAALVAYRRAVKQAARSAPG